MNDNAQVAQALKSQIEEVGMLDVGKRAEEAFGVSRPKFQQALAVLQGEGYAIINAPFNQKGTDMRVVVKVLAKPGTTYSQVVEKGRPNKPRAI